MSFTANGFKICILSHHWANRFLVFEAVNAKNLPIFSANRNAAGKCTKFFRIYGYSTVSSIGKPDIYQLKSLGKSATVFLSVLPIITKIGCRLT